MKGRILAVALLAAVTTPAVAQTSADEARFRAAQERFDRELALFRAEFDRYRTTMRAPAGNDPYANTYTDPHASDAQEPMTAPDQPELPGQEMEDPSFDPARFYRPGPAYRERTLGQDEPVLRGSDGRFYCRRDDGTTGLIAGDQASVDRAMANGYPLRCR